MNYVTPAVPFPLLPPSSPPSPLPSSLPFSLPLPLPPSPFLIFTQLEDGHTLFDYDVGLNDIIQLMIRPVAATLPTSNGRSTHDDGASEGEQEEMETVSKGLMQFSWGYCLLVIEVLSLPGPLTCDQCYLHVHPLCTHVYCAVMHEVHCTAIWALDSAGRMQTVQLDFTRPRVDQTLCNTVHSAFCCGRTA